MASTGGRYTVVTKGPLTGAIACSNSGGYWGAELKMAGWDMVIFEGARQAGVPADQDDVAELRDASHLWGQSVWKTEEALKKATRTRSCASPASAWPARTRCCSPPW
jgi:aldehyde:ferredoxin oxidoreductase